MLQIRLNTLLQTKSIQNVANTTEQISISKIYISSIVIFHKKDRIEHIDFYQNIHV